MEEFILMGIKTLVICLVSVSLFSVVRIVQVYWWRAKGLEKKLRQQGIRGTTYRLFQDDMKETRRCSKVAWSKPMPLKHQIVPRALPFFHQLVQNYGKVSLSRMDTRLRLIVADPEMIKYILANKNGHFIKQPSNSLVNLLQLGVSTLEGDEWVQRRRIINPAFHLEKLKRMVPTFVTNCSGLINRWEKLVGVEGSCKVDVAPEFQNLSSDVIARTPLEAALKRGRRYLSLEAGCFGP